MTASRAPSPQRRRDAQLQQLNDARAQGDQLAINRAELQWVHRYGVGTLPQPVESPESPPLLTVVEPTADPAADAEPATPSPLAAVAPIGTPAQPSPLARFKSEHADCLDTAPVDEVASTDEGANEAEGIDKPLLDRLSPAGAVPPPPSPRLHRLRRWLPTASPDELPRAS
ncbi:hypothetical protein [Synechococcus sp. UW140]|uniref:hypothetical protein n=1 Tax=Synechococcus sp. UW140 TaxID=368503 RepID=UPI000E0E0C3E|nr:hypothetical protein [Synechococcus sp. UW140]